SGAAGTVPAAQRACQPLAGNGAADREGVRRVNGYPHADAEQLRHRRGSPARGRNHCETLCSEAGEEARPAEFVLTAGNATGSLLMNNTPDAGADKNNLRERVMQDSLNGLIAAGLERGDLAINETPEEWHQAARVARQAVRMQLL